MFLSQQCKQLWQCIETDSHNNEITLKGLDEHQLNNECRKDGLFRFVSFIGFNFSVCFALFNHSSQSFQTLSSWATSSVEEVASTGPGIRFFQLYVSLMYFLHFCLLVSELNYILSLFLCFMWLKILLVIMFRSTRTGMLLLNLWEELKELGSRLLPLQLIPQGWVAEKLTSRIGHIKFVIETPLLNNLPFLARRLIISACQVAEV